MKLSMKRALSVSMAALMATGLIAGCSQGESKPQAGKPAENAAAPAKDEPVTLEFWTISLQPKFNDYFNKLFAEYQATHPNVKIDWKDFPIDAIQSRLLTSVASGNVPDVVNLNTELANQVGSKGALADLNQHLTPEQKAAYFDGIYNSTVLNGKAYGLPWYTSASVLFMNKKLVEKAGLDPKNPPKTREELFQWARTIKEKTGAAGFARAINSSIFGGEGIPLLSADKKTAAFNTPEGVKFIDEYAKLYKEGVIPKEDANFDKQVAYFAGEQTAFQMSGTTFINRIKTAAPEVYQNTVVASLPLGKSGTRTSNTMNMVVPAKSKNVKAAVEFGVFLTNAKNQLEFSKVANTLPSTKDSIKDPFYTQTDGSLEAEAKLASAKGLEKASDFLLGVEKAGDVNTAVNKRLQNIFLNGADIKTELDAAAKDVDNVLK
ncbi:sugar ABC transporter substrate-binding protein [Paenibacillus sp. GD4]|jgi:putative chitobiose transport system substrate-binding protein|uniref:ABC transporter substrate-binding protein n=1 Tax=Paenibacillus sp. GD4 TaxID=3068890 RepID=UPI0027969932|nr:sugar ABC transporter substrate-binding protein [Paenibacillus sp. GD4]MDQ1911833.1 sugar ABC transporter substrate-binding protein [Paenibacillus sp. GD4]